MQGGGGVYTVLSDGNLWYKPTCGPGVKQAAHLANTQLILSLECPRLNTRVVKTTTSSPQHVVFTRSVLSTKDEKTGRGSPCLWEGSTPQ